MRPLNQLTHDLSLIETKIAYIFRDKTLLILSLSHRSFVHENRELVQTHNERLEFLGDSVLGLILSEFLYQRLPQETEGHLSKLRSRLVDAASCAEYLRKLHLEPYILLGRGEAMTEGRAKGSILADVFEAIVGAIYLDGGYDAARLFVLRHFQDEIEKAIGSPPRNYKAELQDFSQKKFQKPPVYKVLEEAGPDHAKTFLVAVYLNEQESGQGTGASKKQAEQNAALQALDYIERFS